MRQSKTSEDLLRHTAAARAFHTGLVADTQRLRDILNALERQLDVVRDQAGRHAEKLDAAEASCVHLKTLESVGDSWRDTYWDLRRSVRRVRFHLRRTTPKKARITSRR